MKFIIFIAQINIISLIFYPTVKTSDWSYSDQQNWANGENQCDGTNQSPIDIRTIDVISNTSMKIDFINYDKQSISYRVTNNGHSVQFDYIGDLSSAPTITGTALNYEQYKLAQFHFHWGSAKHIGSEHKINSRAFPVEMHLVHYNRKYNSLSDALEARDGSVTVLGAFFEIKKYNSGFEVVSNMIAEVQEHNANQSINLNDAITLKALLPKNLEKFYRYHGSLTTPPCTEGIIWLVLNQPNEIGLPQFEKFLGVIDQHGEKVANNFRRIQKLNGRKVESSFNIDNNNKGFLTKSAINVIIFLSIAGLSGSSFLPLMN